MPQQYFFVVKLQVALPIFYFNRGWCRQHFLLARLLIFFSVLERQGLCLGLIFLFRSQFFQCFVDPLPLFAEHVVDDKILLFGILSALDSLFQNVAVSKHQIGTLARKIFPDGSGLNRRQFYLILFIVIFAGVVLLMVPLLFDGVFVVMKIISELPEDVLRGLGVAILPGGEGVVVF